MNMREKMARAMCQMEGTDPDHICYGLGGVMPKDSKYAAWEYQAKKLDAALVVAREEPTPEFLDIEMLDRKPLPPRQTLEYWRQFIENIEAEK